MTGFLIQFGQNPRAVWSVLALLLAVVEPFTLDLMLLMLAAGAPAGGVVVPFLLHLLWLQVIAAPTIAVATLFLLRPTFLERARRAPGYHSSLDKLIGSFGEVVPWITSNPGEVKIDGRIQQARGYDDAIAIEAGERIEVYKLGGTTLIVYPIAN